MHYYISFLAFWQYVYSILIKRKLLLSLYIFQQNPYPSNAVKINEIKRDVKNLEEKIKSMQKQYVELNKNLKLEKDKIETIEKLENKLNKISEKEKQQEQEQTRKKKRNI